MARQDPEAEVNAGLAALIGRPEAEVATHRDAIARLLAEQGLGPRAPPAERAKVRVPEQMVLGFGDASG